MNRWILILSLLALVSINVSFAKTKIIIAKQEDNPGLRVVNQEYGLTAGDQSQKPSDILTTKKIRSELMKDSTLSFKAKNIAIITINNGVTLKGSVENAEQRKRILEHAYLTAPKHKIYNQISVKK